MLNLLFMQVVLHTLRGRIVDKGKKKTGKRIPCSAKDRSSLHSAIAAAMQPYLGRPNSCKFACYVVSFLCCVDNIATWDRTMHNRAAATHQTTPSHTIAISGSHAFRPAGTQVRICCKAVVHAGFWKRKRAVSLSTIT
jgi:hypothetical protein